MRVVDMSDLNNPLKLEAVLRQVINATNGGIGCIFRDPVAPNFEDSDFNFPDRPDRVLYDKRSAMVKRNTGPSGKLGNGLDATAADETMLLEYFSGEAVSMLRLCGRGFEHWRGSPTSAASPVIKSTSTEPSPSEM